MSHSNPVSSVMQPCGWGTLCPSLLASTPKVLLIACPAPFPTCRGSGRFLFCYGCRQIYSPRPVAQAASGTNSLLYRESDIVLILDSIDSGDQLFRYPLTASSSQLALQHCLSLNMRKLSMLLEKGNGIGRHT